MRRFAYTKMLEWKKSTARKPLIVRGARQVGKTWLMKTFAQKEYKNVVYLNFEEKKQLQQLFANDFNIQRIMLAFQVETGIKPEPRNTLIILDEIQEAERGITSLKYFNENAPEYHVMAAGSYLGISMQKDASFPVGQVAFLDLYPLNFQEFLIAIGEEPLVELISQKQWPLISTFKTKYIELLKQYYFLGGMPEVIDNFIKNKDLNVVRTLQKQLIQGYQQDFAKHAPTEIVPRIRMVWESIPAQLAKENKKFIFGLIKHGARAKEFELALEWLIDSGLIYRVNRIAKPALPLSSYKDNSAFKAFLVDVGLLGALSNLDAKTLIDGSRIFEEFKGALTEQFVYQQIVQKEDMGIYYWSAERSSGEIDFVVQKSNSIIPIEVKASENLQAKSLKIFKQKYKTERAIRTSMSDYREEEWLTNIPLYAISSL